MTESLLSFFSPKETDTSGIAPHSRRVKQLKILLPLVAMALAAMLILWPALKPRQRAGIRTESTALEMREARFSGFDDQNRAYNITAASMLKSSGDDRIVHLDGPMADISMAGDAWLALRGEKAVLDDNVKRMDIDGHVVVFHSDGYTMDMDNLVFSFGSGDLWSDGSVTGQGPRGSLSSAGFRLDGATGNIVFKGPARFVIPNDRPTEKP